MSLILTVLGKGGTGRTTVAIAMAKYFAQQGKRVLFASQDAGPGVSLLLGQTLSHEPQTIEPNLQAMQFQLANLMEQVWEEVKQMEAQYVRTPFFKDVFGQELGILPGMDSALALNTLKNYDASGQYDVIVYDGAGDAAMLRMLGMPEILSWYIRRFRQVFIDSDLGRTVSPFIQPLTSAVLNVNWASDNFSQPVGQVNGLLDQGKAAVTDPKRFLGYLVTTDDPVAIATARYLWGAAQQVGLTVGGVIANRSDTTTHLDGTFAPLTTYPLPVRAGDNWQPLLDRLPNMHQAAPAPKPIEINVAARTVRLFLPGFDKTQVKLTQYGPEVTIEAGDQRRNIALPPELKNQPVTGAKFQDGYLTISF